MTDRNPNPHGRVEIDLAPRLRDQHNTEYSETSTHSHRQLVATICATIGALLVAFLAAWQGCEAHRVASIAQDTYNAANTPYVGAATVVHHIHFDFGLVPPDNAGTVSLIPLYVGISYTIKNFGPLPALRELETFQAVPDTGSGVFPKTPSTKHANFLKPCPGNLTLERSFSPLPRTLERSPATGPYFPAKPNLRIFGSSVCTAYQDPRGN